MLQSTTVIHDDHATQVNGADGVPPFPSGLEVVAAIAAGSSDAARVLADQGVSLEWIAARLRHLAEHATSEQARIMALHELRLLAESAGMRA